MISLNSLMKNELSMDKTTIDSKTMLKIVKTAKKLTKNIKCRYGYLIAHKSTINLKDKKMVCKIFGDKTGAEASINEISINRELQLTSVSPIIALRFFQEYNVNLKIKYNVSFCSILSKNNVGDWIFRFHTITYGENLWVDENIDNYMEPILYEIF